MYTELAKHPNSLASWRKLYGQFAQVEVVVGYNSMLYEISIPGMGRTNRDVIEVLLMAHVAGFRSCVICVYVACGIDPGINFDRVV